VIPRKEVVGRLLEAGYHFHERGKRVEIYRQQGTSQRVSVTLRDKLDVREAGIVLAQAGLTDAQIDKFLKACLKD